MKIPVPSSLSSCTTLVLLYLATHDLLLLTRTLTAHACVFPDFLQTHEGDEQCNWYSGVRKDRSRETCYSVRHNVMEVRHNFKIEGRRRNVVSARRSPFASSSSSSSPLRQQPVRWKCSLSFHGKLLLKRTDPQSLRELSACVQFVRRSKSVVQAAWSRESNQLDPALCEDRNLALDPRPLVSFRLVQEDYTPSPFRGGYSMRITDSVLGENGCNYMHRPMKFESDCLAGEGIMFDFISESCLPSSAAPSVLVKQRLLPVAAWRHGGDHYVILRRRDDRDLFCLRMPSTRENHLNAFLFTDLACLTAGPRELLGSVRDAGEGEWAGGDDDRRRQDVVRVPGGKAGRGGRGGGGGGGGPVRYLVLHLQRYVYRELCDDEYPQCSAVTCNSYFRRECHKSCKVCDARRPPPSCSFPRRIRGQWYQMDANGLNHVNVTEKELTVDNTGSFRCAVFPDSPPRKTRMYTTVSLFSNGCRPRYTCVKLKRLGPAVLRYTLSRSFVWPELEDKFGQAICAPSQFGVDPEPIHDLYRTPEDTGKPIIAYNPDPERVQCNLSSSYTVTATFPNGSLCHGSLFEHCEDSTRLRLHFHAGCGQVITRVGETFPGSLPYRPSSSSTLGGKGGTSSSSSSETRWSSRGGGTRQRGGGSGSGGEGPWIADYSCLAHYEGHYWERMVMLQNVRNRSDARCLLFTQLDASDALMMVSGQCDKNAYNRASAGLRTPLLSLQLRQDEFPCKFLPITTTTTTTPTTAGSLLDSEGRVGEDPYAGHRGRQHHTKRPSVSYAATVSPAGGPNHRISAPYEEPEERERTPIDYGGNPELSPMGGSGVGASSPRPAAAGLIVLAAAMIVAVAARPDWIIR